MVDDLIPLADLVGVFKRSKATLYRWAANGAIPTRKIGTTIYMHRDDVERFTSPLDRITAELDSRKTVSGVVLPPEDMSLVVNALNEALTVLRHAKRSHGDGAA